MLVSSSVKKQSKQSWSVGRISTIIYSTELKKRVGGGGGCVGLNNKSAAGNYYSITKTIAKSKPAFS